MRRNSGPGDSLRLTPDAGSGHSWREKLNYLAMAVVAAGLLSVATLMALSGSSAKKSSEINPVLRRLASDDPAVVAATRREILARGRSALPDLRLALKDKLLAEQVARLITEIESSPSSPDNTPRGRGVRKPPSDP